MSELTQEQAIAFFRGEVKRHDSAEARTCPCDRCEASRALLVAYEDQGREIERLRAEKEREFDIATSYHARWQQAEAREAKLEEGMEIAWGIIANACGGNWDHAANLPGWKQAAERWRDEYWRAITAPLVKRAALLRREPGPGLATYTQGPQVPGREQSG